MSVKRASHFLKKVILSTIILFSTLIILATIETLFHPFTPWIDTCVDWLTETEKNLQGNSLMGVSSGMIALTLLVCLFPLFMRRVNKKQYRTNTFRGVLSSVIFFFSQALYAWAERFGKLHLMGAMLMAIAVTLIIIEFLALLSRVDEEVSLRTDLISACAAGLASGIVIKLIQIFISQIPV